MICDYPFSSLLAFHQSHGHLVTLLSTPVEDPSKYGIIVTNEENRVTSFIEKPKEFITNRVNTGIYVFSTQIIDKIELKPHYLEKEVFPRLCEEGEVYCMQLKGYWMDIGQPKDYLAGTKMYLAWLKEKKESELAKGDNIIGNVIIHSTAQVDHSSVIGPNVTIGETCIIERGVRLADCVILSKTHIKSHAFVRNSIIGWQSIIGQWVRIEGVSVVGEDV